MSALQSRKSTSQHGSRFQGIAGGQTAAAAALAATRQYTYGQAAMKPEGSRPYLNHANTINN